MPLLEVVGVSKSFPGVKALRNVSLRVEAGEVLAVVGENGAGKSTLMKILAGIYEPDEGTVRLDGREVRFDGPADAMDAGIVLIHQELNLAENLTVTANLFLGREPMRFGLIGLPDERRMRRQAAELLKRVGLTPDLADAPVSELPPGRKQLVEIARALGQSARVIIMDEPTSSLTQRESDRLAEVIDELKRSGVAVVYISHRLGEVHRVANHVTVLRDGANAGQLCGDEITHDAIVKLMVGRDLQQYYPRTHPDDEHLEQLPERLRVTDLTFAGGPERPISFRLRGGEIVGMAGLVGAGRSELAEAIFGLRPMLDGRVHLDGKPIRIRSPRSMIRSGVLLVPEDRRLHGLILPESVGFNLSLPNLEMVSILRWVMHGRESELGESLAKRVNVRCSGLDQTVGLLSGGNQQKVVLGKWLAHRPNVLILDEPTRGVDVGAKSEIYTLMDGLARTGVAVLMISSDLEEILGMSDRVIVLHEGKLAGVLPLADE